MKKFTTIFLVALAFNATAQLLTASRAKHIKECTVRITVTGTGSVGTGFLITNNGVIVTCFHVIAPSISYNTNTHSLDRHDITVEFQNGSKIVYGIPDMLANPLDSAIKYDMCIIVPKFPISKQTPFLKIGNYQNANDGDEIVTCGFPFGTSRSFLSRGMVGSKIVDTVIIPYPNRPAERTPRNEAILDITMNKGNSGGAIYKIGDRETDDEVIGIADFIITPAGKDIIDLLDTLKKTNQQSGQVLIKGIDPNTTMAKTIETLTNFSDGVSGCISIQYVQNLAAIAMKQHR